MRTQAGTALSLSTFPAPEKLPVPFDSAQGTIRALSGVEAQFLSRQTAASGGVGCYSENAPDEFIGDVRALKAHDTLFGAAETQQVDAAVPDDSLIHDRFGFREGGITVRRRSRCPLPDVHFRPTVPDTGQGVLSAPCHAVSETDRGAGRLSGASRDMMPLRPAAPAPARKPLRRIHRFPPFFQRKPGDGQRADGVHLADAGQFVAGARQKQDD